MIARPIPRSSLLIAALALALASTRPALAQRPNQAEDESATFVDDGRAALKRGDLDEAGKALDQAISLNPRRVEAYVLRAAVYAARKRYRDGVALMRRAQQLAPGDPEVLTALGSQLVLAGDPEAGVPLLQQVVAQEPSRYDAQLLLGHHWHDTGQWSGAITALEAYFAHRPGALAQEDARHQVDLADAYLRARQPSKALELFAAASAHAPRTATGTRLRARVGLAWATAAVDCRKARPLLRDLEPIAEQRPEVWLVEGQCALALGDPAGALALGRRYLELAAKSSAAGHALVGEAHAARGNLADARQRARDRARPRARPAAVHGEARRRVAPGEPGGRCARDTRPARAARAAGARSGLVRRGRRGAARAARRRRRARPARSGDAPSSRATRRSTSCSARRSSPRTSRRPPRRPSNMPNTWSRPRAANSCSSTRSSRRAWRSSQQTRPRSPSRCSRARSCSTIRTRSCGATSASRASRSTSRPTRSACSIAPRRRWFGGSC